MNAFAVEMINRKPPWRRSDRLIAGEMHLWLRESFLSPGPRVTEPKRGKNCERRGIRTPIDCGNLDTDVARCRLGVFDEDVEITALVEGARVHQFEFGLEPGSTRVLINQALIREFLLRILVKAPHVAVRRRIIKMVKIVLNIFTMITL